MDEWWKRNSDIEKGDYKEYVVEDITGRIPLLLDKCKVDGKIDLAVADLRNVYDKAVSFVQRIRAENQNGSYRWKWYVRLIQRSGHY
jgi:hypothetical protein